MRSYKIDEFTFHRESSKFYAATYKNVNCSVSHLETKGFSCCILTAMEKNSKTAKSALIRAGQ